MLTDTSLTGLCERLAAVCRTQPVTLVYVYGSYARGTADPESDLDVAVLAEASLSADDRHRLRFRLLGACEEALPIPHPRLDLVVLQDVPTLLQYNVVRTGRVLFARTPAEHRAFERDVTRRYDDERPLLDREADRIVERLLARAV